MEIIITKSLNCNLTFWIIPDLVNIVSWCTHTGINAIYYIIMLQHSTVYMYTVYFEMRRIGRSNARIENKHISLLPVLIYLSK